MKNGLLTLSTLLLLMAASVTSCSKTQTSTPSPQNSNLSTLNSQLSTRNSTPSDLTPDQLQGHVKLCSTKAATCDANGKTDENTYWDEIIKIYTPEGKIDEQSDLLSWRLPNPQISRNEQQQITQVKWYISEYQTYVSETYKYNEQGLISTCLSEGIESVDTIVYTYGDHNQLTHSESVGYGEGSIFRATTDYTILAVDEQGNWIRRLLKSTYETGPDDADHNLDNLSIDQMTFPDSWTDYTIEIRAILYY